jgi:hypothetical protein
LTDRFLQEFAIISGISPQALRYKLRRDRIIACILRIMRTDFRECDRTDDRRFEEASRNRDANTGVQERPAAGVKTAFTFVGGIRG